MKPTHNNAEDKHKRKMYKTETSSYSEHAKKVFETEKEKKIDT